MDRHKSLLLCRVTVVTVCHMYRFGVNIRKERQERNSKILLLLMWSRSQLGLQLTQKIWYSKHFSQTRWRITIYLKYLQCCSKKQKYMMKGYAKLYIRKITDIVFLGMQNEGCRKYLNVQRVTGRTGLLRAFLNFTKGRTCV